MDRPQITQEEAHRLMIVLARKGRGTIQECWEYIKLQFEIVDDRGRA